MKPREYLVIAREALDAAMQHVGDELRTTTNPDQAVSLSYSLRAIIRERNEIEYELHRISVSRNDG